MWAGTGERRGGAGRGLHAVARAQAEGRWHPVSRFGLAEGSRARFTNGGACVRASWAGDNEEPQPELGLNELGTARFQDLKSTALV